jgi:hypothetical protein
MGYFVLLLFALRARAEDPAEVAREVLGSPDLRYTTTWTVPCSGRTFEALVASPLVTARLWDAYGYAPAYRASSLGDTLLVLDPTGLEGKALLLDRTPSEVRYLVYGKLDHWAVPFFNRGLAVMSLRSAEQDGRMECQVEIAIRAESTLSSLVLQAAEGLIMERVRNRVTLNLVDAASIFVAVDRDPAAVKQKLNAEDGRGLDAVLTH